MWGVFIVMILMNYNYYILVMTVWRFYVGAVSKFIYNKFNNVYFKLFLK